MLGSNSPFSREEQRCHQVLLLPLISFVWSLDFCYADRWNCFKCQQCLWKLRMSKFFQINLFEIFLPSTRCGSFVRVWVCCSLKVQQVPRLRIFFSFIDNFYETFPTPTEHNFMVISQSNCNGQERWGNDQMINSSSRVAPFCSLMCLIWMEWRGSQNNI